jgi:hypothetical protein
VAALAISGCAAGDEMFTADAPAGFWAGLWHGMISVITLVIGIFSDNVGVYESNNTGGWYDFGFLLGVLCIWGSGHKTYDRTWKKPRRDKEWEEIGKKVEVKMKRKIRDWAEAEPDDDWEVVGHMAEDKFKRRVREWAEEP